MQPPKKRERISALKSVSGPHNAHSSTNNCNSSWTAPIEQPVLVTYMSQELLLPLMSWQWSYVSFQSSPHSENSALKMSQNSQSVEYLLYPTQPSEMYGLGPYLDIKNSTSRITWHWTVCSSLTLSCHIPFEELTSLYIPDLQTLCQERPATAVQTLFVVARHQDKSTVWSVLKMSPNTQINLAFPLVGSIQKSSFAPLKLWLRLTTLQLQSSRTQVNPVAPPQQAGSVEAECVTGHIPPNHIPFAKSGWLQVNGMAEVLKEANMKRLLTTHSLILFLGQWCLY